MLILASCSTSKKQTFDVVITNAQLIDFSSGELQTRSVYINDGKIVKILDSLVDDYVAEKNIDATGKYLLPGFWDNHVHFRGGDSLIASNKELLKLFIANGVTTVRDAGGDLTTSVMQWKEDIAANKLIGPTIYTSGPKIDGPNATWAGSLEVENEEDIKTAIDSLQKIPVDFIKLYDSRISKDAYLNAIKEAERRNMITSGHMPFTVELSDAIDAGIDGVEHLYYVMKGCSSEETAVTGQLLKGEIGFWQAMPILQNTYDDAVAKSTFNKLRSNNVVVIPTLHIGHTLSYLDEEDHTNDEYLKYMSPGIQKTYEGRIKGALSASPEASRNRKKLDSFFGNLAYNLSKNDVTILAGSDSGAFNSYTYPGISIHKEMEALANAGLSPLEVLLTSAYNGAVFLKKDGDQGAIKENYIADLVLLNTNPLEDIKNTEDINTVIKNGNLYPRKELDSLLRSIKH